MARAVTRSMVRVGSGGTGLELGIWNGEGESKQSVLKYKAASLNVKSCLWAKWQKGKQVKIIKKNYKCLDWQQKKPLKTTTIATTTTTTTTTVTATATSTKIRQREQRQQQRYGKRASTMKNARPGNYASIKCIAQVN